jgi:formate dehydrogenase major subunit
MDLGRRDFLKLSELTTRGMLLPRDLIATTRRVRPLSLRKPTGETPTICCFCGVGCGAIVSADTNRAYNIVGDPDHPINQGYLCSKGMSLARINTVGGKINPRRLQKVEYRAPGSDHWEESTL